MLLFQTIPHQQFNDKILTVFYYMYKVIYVTDYKKFTFEKTTILQIIYST